MPVAPARATTRIPATACSYLFDDLAADPAHHLPVADPAATVAALEQLGAAMVQDPPDPADPRPSTASSTVAPVYTCWGQLIAHDLTADTDLRASRDPALNLDSVYGDGPTLDPAHPTGAAELYDGIRLKVGSVALADENLMVDQLRTAFRHFHNVAVDWVGAHEPERNTEVKVFRRARQLTRWHYQWLVVNDYLKTVTVPGSTDKIVLGENRILLRWESDEVSMPVSSSSAASRLGHSLVRGAYDFDATGPVITTIVPSLSTRNLLRGYLLSLPTGQAVAQTTGATPLTAAELTQGNKAAVNDALAAGGFVERTPLWFYVRKEAEVRAGGDSLGEVGSRIVNETVIARLRSDVTSYLDRSSEWDPSLGITMANGDAIVTIADFLRVAGAR